MTSRNASTTDSPAQQPQQHFSDFQGYLPSDELRRQVDWANEQLDAIFEQLAPAGRGAQEAAAAADPRHRKKWSRRHNKLPSGVNEAELNDILRSDFLSRFLPQVVPFLKRAADESDDRSSETVQQINLVFYNCVKLTAISLPWCHVGILDSFCSLFAQAYTPAGEDNSFAKANAADLNTSVSTMYLPGAIFSDVRPTFVDALRLRKQVQRRKTTLRAFTKRSMDLVGRCVRHVWPNSNLAYGGMIVDYSPRTRKHLIHYVDGEKHWTMLEALRGLSWLKDKYVKTHHRELEMNANDVDKVLQIISKTLRRKKVTYDEEMFDFESAVPQAKHGLAGGGGADGVGAGAGGGRSDHGDEFHGEGFTNEEMLTVKAYDSRTRRHLVLNEEDAKAEPRWIDVTEDMVPYAYRDNTMRKVVTKTGVKIRCYIIRRKCSALGLSKWYTPDPDRRLAFDRSDKGLRIRIWWPGEKQWFKAVIRKFAAPKINSDGTRYTSGKATGHMLKYDDGEKKW